jgi:NAD(P)-dependent dehydrogenase (short-subunit alcohol dehydrogenase family)
MTNNKPIDIKWPDEYSPQNTPILVTNELLMNASAERVFALILDAEKWPKFYFNASKCKNHNSGRGKLSLASETALKRVGLPDDIGSVVAFLCSDDSKWINAQRIELSGRYRI